MRISRCRSCGSAELLLYCQSGHAAAEQQIGCTIPPEVLNQQDYPYFSLSSQALLDHARASAKSLRDAYGLNKDSFVVEVASNDGYLLRNFVTWGIPVIGIDPVEGPAKAAIAHAVPTMQAFFSGDLARKQAAIRKADVIIASNVVSHVDQINDFVQGFDDVGGTAAGASADAGPQSDVPATSVTCCGPPPKEAGHLAVTEAPSNSFPSFVRHRPLA